MEKNLITHFKDYRMIRSRLKPLALGLCLAFCLLLTSMPAIGEDRNFLWRVESKTGPASYIFGSVHQGQPDFYPLNKTIEKAYAESLVLVVEVDLNRIDKVSLETRVLALGRYHRPDSIEHHLSARTLAKLDESGLDLEEIKGIKPWLLTQIIENNILTGLGYDLEFGLDNYFLKRAAKEKKTVKELESLDFQLELFTGLTEKEQDLLLFATLLEMERADWLISSSISAWRQGDLEKFEETLFKIFRPHPELNSILDRTIFDRNLEMVNKIEGYLLTGQSHFIVVGAAHLVGPRGIIEILKARGFPVQRL